MANARHHDSTSKLTPDEHVQLRKLIADRGVGKAALVLRSTEATLMKLAEGPGLTKAARDRIAMRLEELRPEAIAEPRPTARATFAMLHVEGDADAVIAALGAFGVGS